MRCDTGTVKQIGLTPPEPGRGPAEAFVAEHLIDLTDGGAVATFIRAYALGMVERYLDNRPTSREAVVEVILRAVGVFMTEPNSA